MNTSQSTSQTEPIRRRSSKRFRRLALTVVAAFSGVTAVTIAHGDTTAPPDTSTVLAPRDLSTPWPDQKIFCSPAAVTCIYPSPYEAQETHADGSGGIGIIDVWPMHLSDPTVTPETVGSTIAP